MCCWTDHYELLRDFLLLSPVGASGRFGAGWFVALIGLRVDLVRVQISVVLSRHWLRFHVLISGCCGFLPGATNEGKLLRLSCCHYERTPAGVFLLSFFLSFLRCCCSYLP